MRYNLALMGDNPQLVKDQTMKRVDEVLVSLRRIIRATDIHSKKLSKHSGLTSPQLLILMAIDKLGDVTIGTVAKDVNLSQATVTTILDRLEKRGLVQRVRSQVDRRRVHAKLTDEGLSIVEDAPSPLQESFVEKFDTLPEWEQTMILSSLQKLAELMQASEIDAAPVLHVGEVTHHYSNTPSSTSQQS